MLSDVGVEFRVSALYAEPGILLLFGFFAHVDFIKNVESRNGHAQSKEVEKYSEDSLGM